MTETFDSFYLREFRSMVALAAAVSGSHLLAEDLAQEAMTRVYRRWDRIAGYDKPGAFARRVTINLALSRRKRDIIAAAGEPLVTEIPFTVEEDGQLAVAPSVEANQIAGRLVAFLLGSPEVPPLANEVLLRLGNTGTVPRTAAQLGDRSMWVVDAEFNAYVGPFDLLEIVANRPHVKVSEGPIAHCAAPPIDWWPGADLARPQINIEPIGIDSCLQWYAISLRVNASGEIQDIVLDLWEP